MLNLSLPSIKKLLLALNKIPSQVEKNSTLQEHHGPFWLGLATHPNDVLSVDEFAVPSILGKCFSYQNIQPKFLPNALSTVDCVWVRVGHIERTV